MIERICHIGPALSVQGGISSVLISYKKLFALSDKHFISSYNGSFIKSLPRLLLVCFKIIFGAHLHFEFYQIHTSSYGSFFRKFLISLCLRLRKQKYTVHIHGSEFKKFCMESAFILRYCIKSYFNHSSGVICITPDMKDFLNQFLKNKEILYFTLPNPCENISIKPVNLEAHDLPVKIIFSGRYGKRKGVYDLIRAFDVAEFSLPVELHLFGDGEIDLVRAMASNSKKSKDIYVSCWIPHKDYLEILSSYDFLVLASYAETFGMSLVEAMGYGLPVISTNVDAIPYVVEDKKSGFLIQPGDIEALIQAMITLVHHKALRVKMGKAGWEKASQEFSGVVIQKKIEAIYMDLK